MIYLNTAGTGKLSTNAVAFAKKYYDEMVETGSLAAVKWREALDLPLRKDVSHLFGADLEQVALLPNTSFALNSVAQRLMGERKRVLMIEGDYPSITLPWKLLAFDCVEFKTSDGIIDSQLLIEELREQRIEVVVLSHVMWHTGFKVDIDAICTYCAKNGIISIVDVTQSLGAIPISMKVTKADVMISSCYKWLYAGFGLGLMAMSKSFFDSFPPQIGGFASYADIDGEWSYQPSMKSYQPGSLSISSMAILRTSIQELFAIGIEQIESISRERARRLVELLSAYPVQILGRPAHTSQSNLVCIASVPGLFKHLEQHAVIVVERNNHIRFSVSHTTTEGELSELDHILEQFFSLS